MNKGTAGHSRPRKDAAGANPRQPRRADKSGRDRAADEAEDLRQQLLAEAGEIPEGPGQLDALLDRAYLADSFFEEHVLQDPACLRSPELFRAAWEVAQALAGFYQRVGQEIPLQDSAGGATP